MRTQASCALRACGVCARTRGAQEARALYEWLRANPEAELELLDVVSQQNSDAAAFIVRRGPSSAAVVCAA